MRYATLDSLCYDGISLLRSVEDTERNFERLKRNTQAFILESIPFEGFKIPGAVTLRGKEKYARDTSG